MPSPRSSRSTTRQLEALDADFADSGVVRAVRSRGAVRLSRPAQLERADIRELQRPIPQPQVAPNGVQWLAVPGWEKFDWLWHGFSTRKSGLSRVYAPEDAEGDLNLGFTATDDRETVLANRRLLVEAITGDASTPLITLKQIHSNVVAEAGPDRSDQPCKGDGLITAEPGILLAVQTADCTPVLVFDRKRRVAAAFHAGWRGTAKRIVESGIGRMRLAFGSQPKNLVAAIGPGIGPCCYAVGEEVLSEFESQFAYARTLFREVYDTDPVRRKYPMLFLTQRAPGHSPLGPALHLDLVEANRRQLLAAGLAPESIQVMNACTQCHTDLFFSHRASRGHAGRMMAVIGIR